MKDQEFLAEAAKMQADIAPTTGEGVQIIIANIYATRSRSSSASRSTLRSSHARAATPYLSSLGSAVPMLIRGASVIE
jgi:hypothetical protein